MPKIPQLNVPDILGTMPWVVPLQANIFYGTGSVIPKFREQIARGGNSPLACPGAAP